MAVHLKDPRIHVEDANGNPYVGAKLFVYDTGGTVLQSIFTDSALSVAAANPLTSLSDGYFPLTYLTAGTYKVRIEQSDGTLIIEADNQDTGIPLGSGVLAIANGGTGGATAAAARTALGVPANSEITTITADILLRLKKTGGILTGDTNHTGTGFFAIPSGTTAQQTSPANGTGLRFNSTTGQLEAYINSVWTEMVALPTGYIDGLIMANGDGAGGGDQDHDIKISPGACRNVQTSNSDNTNIRLSAAITKRIDAPWAVGDAAGGLDGGTVGANTWYHKFIIRDTTNGITDALFSSSLASPTLPTNYTKSRRIGAVRTDGSNNILGFTQIGDEFLWDDPPRDNNSALGGTTAVSITLSTPLGIKTKAIMNVYWAVNAILYLSSPDQDDEAASVTAAPLGSVAAGGAGTSDASQNHIWTNTSSQIRARASADGTPVIATTGWTDPRGRDK